MSLTVWKWGWISDFKSLAIWGWTEAGEAVVVLNFFKVVHEEAEVSALIQSEIIPKIVKGAFTGSVVKSESIPRTVQERVASKAVLNSFTAKMIEGRMVCTAVHESGAPGKMVNQGGISKVIVSNTEARRISRLEKVGKVFR